MWFFLGISPRANWNTLHTVGASHMLVSDINAVGKTSEQSCLIPSQSLCQPCNQPLLWKANSTVNYYYYILPHSFLIIIQNRKSLE